jgi:prepilin signal peptidase PulO-like enzyme (type II secretory pathway)
MILIETFFAFIFGLLLGSFINCLAWRLYKEETILGRSYCPKCLKQLDWFDNIPLFSFLMLKGKCRHCSKKISWQYPLVELVTGLLFAAAYVNFFGYSWWFLLKIAIVILVLVLVFIFDFRWYLIPVSFLLWVGGVLAVLGFFSYPYGLGAYIIALLISVITASLFFAIQYWITKGKGIGEGDIWLGAFLGIVFVNLSELIVAVLSAYFIGSIFGLILIALKKKKLSGKLPLGVFLTLGAVISIFFGHDIAYWYWGLFLS